jgi:hypothetical protein
MRLHVRNDYDNISISFSCNKWSPLDAIWRHPSGNGTIFVGEWISLINLFICLWYHILKSYYVTLIYIHTCMHVLFDVQCDLYMILGNQTAAESIDILRSHGICYGETSPLNAPQNIIWRVNNAFFCVYVQSGELHQWSVSNSQFPRVQTKVWVRIVFYSLSHW